MLQIKNLTLSYGQDRPILDQLNLDIKDHSFTVIVGPSGCGKTTTLRAIAGLETIDSGQITLDGEDIMRKQPGERNLAMVFQNYAIYPHFSVKENIEFGLRNYELSKAEIQNRSNSVLDITGLKDYSDRLPNTLSGGQRQRVALSRAISKSPKVFLMDEPLSNLDAKLRNEMRSELIQLHKRLNNIFIYVTHDQTEALSMGTDIIIMDQGEIMQQGSPEEVYDNPRNIFVAKFIGDPGMNVMQTFDGRYIGFRSSAGTFNSIEDSYALEAELLTKEFMGEYFMYSLRHSDDTIKIKDKERIDKEGLVKVYIPNEKLYYFDQSGQSCDPFHPIELRV